MDKCYASVVVGGYQEPYGFKNHMIDFLAYPSVGLSVILPPYQVNGFRIVEVLVCGGMQANAFSARNGMTWPPLQMCLQIQMIEL